MKNPLNLFYGLLDIEALRELRYAGKNYGAISDLIPVRDDFGVRYRLDLAGRKVQSGTNPREALKGVNAFLKSRDLPSIKNLIRQI